MCHVYFNEYGINLFTWPHPCVNIMSTEKIFFVTTKNFIKPLHVDVHVCVYSDRENIILDVERTEYLIAGELLANMFSLWHSIIIRNSRKELQHLQFSCVHVCLFSRIKHNSLKISRIIYITIFFLKNVM